MPRWIIPASVVAILVSLAAIVILMVASTGGTTSANVEQDVEQDLGQVEEPEVAPEPEDPGAQGGLTAPEEEPTGQPEQPLEEDQTADQQPTQQEPLAPGPSTATIRITGDSSYYCSLGVIGETETVQGRRPASYEVEVATGGTALDTVMAACQKISPGSLGLRVLYDDEVVAQDETNARLGTVSVAWNPLAE